MINDKEIYDNLQKIKYVALLLTKNEDDANDLLQETAIRALKNKDKYNSEFGKMTTWLSTVMKNIHIDMCRKNKNRNVFINESDLSDGISDYMILKPNVNGGYQNIKYNEIINIINNTIEDEIDKEIFFKQLNGYKLRELAKIFDKNINTIKGKLRNTKIAIQKVLKNY